MKTVPAGLATRLTENITALAMAYTLVRVDKTKFRFTTGSQDVELDDGLGNGPQTFLASEGFLPSATEKDSELTTGNVEMVGFSSDLLLDSEMDAGLFDGAEIFGLAYDQVNPELGFIKMFRGNFGQFNPTNTGVFKSEVRDLQQNFGGRQFGELYSKDHRVDIGSPRDRLPINPPLRTPNTVYTDPTKNTPGFYVRVPTNFPVGRFGTVTVPNGGFETGDGTNWTLSSSAAVVNETPFEGSWHIEHDNSATATATADIIDLRESGGGSIPDADLASGAVILEFSAQFLTFQTNDPMELEVELLNSSDVIVETITSGLKDAGTGGGLVAGVYTKVTANRIADNIDTTIAKARIRWKSNRVVTVDNDADDFQIAFENTTIPISSDAFENIIYRLTVAGTSSAEVNPTFNAVVDMTTVDGTATWIAEDAWSQRFVVTAVDSVEPRRKFRTAGATPISGGPRGGFPDDWFNFGGLRWRSGDNEDVVPLVEIADFAGDTIPISAITTISFTAPDIIDDSANGLGSFVSGQTITITGSTGNSNTFTVDTAAAGQLTLIEQTIVTEAAGPSITITLEEQQWELIDPQPFNITVGNAFDAYPGHDGTYDQLVSKFDNGINAVCEPFTPDTNQVGKTPDAS